MLTSAIDSNLFGFKGVPNLILVDFLLPNGLFLTLEFSRNASLSEMRDTLWAELAKNPFQLRSKNDFTFSTVTANAQVYEYYNMHLKLCDLNLLHWFFKIVEIQGNLEENKFNADLSIK
jgi:hypothetical protein